MLVQLTLISFYNIKGKKDQPTNYKNYRKHFIGNLASKLFLQTMLLLISCNYFSRCPFFKEFHHN